MAVIKDSENETILISNHNTRQFLSKKWMKMKADDIVWIFNLSQARAS